MSPTDIVREHFNRAAARFDAVYGEDRPLYQRLVDRAFRGVVVERFRLIANLAPLPGRWTVLDVGCGSGRYAVALAAEGAARIVGVDVSEEMIRMAREAAATHGLDDVCDFHVARFLDFTTQERFDVVVATGYFDYLDDPSADLGRMAAMCSGRIFASFPKRFEWRVPVRKLRFAMARSFVRFYSKREVVDLFAGAGIPPERLSLIDLGRDWVAVARR